MPKTPKRQTLNTAQAIRQAADFHKQGKLDESERLCRIILDARPDHFDALHLLGIIHTQLQRVKPAIKYCREALRVSPDHAVALMHLGDALQLDGQNEAAISIYEKALAIDANLVGALNNRGAALAKLTRYRDAVASYDRALEIAPHNVDVLFNRAVALLRLSCDAEAIESYSRVLEIQPNHANAHYNRGTALARLGRHADALASYEKALALNPTLNEAWNNYGTALAKLNRHREAIVSYKKAIELKPNNIRAYHNRGTSLQLLNNHADAVADYDQVVALDPNFEYTLGAAVHSRAHLCEWNNIRAGEIQVENAVQSGKTAIRPFPFLAFSRDVADQLRCSRTFSADKYPAVVPALWNGERYQHQRIRVAYLSADFHDHATAYLMAELFERHDQTRFETIAVSFGPDSQSAMRGRLEAAFERFIDVRQKSDREIASLLREIEVDIAVDLKGFTTDARTGIFAHRPAPIQVNYLGYPGTMGVEYIDYILADRIVIPEEHHPYYVEKIVYLPDCYQVNDSKRAIAEHTPTRVQAGLPEQGFVFCSFNNNYKITPDVFDVWMRLLQQVKGSVLWLLEANPTAALNLQREAKARGVEPGRLVFAQRAKLPEHLARHRLADLFLDTLPYNAHTTASDALWAGLPVLTCLGTTFPGRVAASLLTTLGSSELITHTMQEYEALALKIAADPALLKGIKARLAQNRLTTPLFDAGRFTHHIESAYTTMWETCQRGETARSFAVTPVASA